MSVQVTENPDRHFVDVHVSGRLSRKDYQHFVPEIERLIRSSGKLNILFRMEDFHGWKAGGLWEDIKFDLRHFSHIRRLALVGDKRWERWMSFVCRPFTTAKIRYFDVREADQARTWVTG
jgi:hypothetical protein